MKKALMVLFSLSFLVVFSATSAFADYGADTGEKPSTIVTSGAYTAEEPSTVVTSIKTLRTSVSQTSKMLSGRISKIISPNPKLTTKNNLIGFDYYPGYNNQKVTGLSAGDTAPKFGIWANASYTQTDDDSSFAHSSSDLILMMLGADFKPAPNMVIGLALGYENGETDTYFNNGEQDSDGFTLSPYFAYLINEYFSFDLSGGYSWVDYDQFRTDADEKISSSLDSDRWFVSAALHAYKNINAWNFTGNLSYTISRESQDSFTESNGTQVRENDIDLSTIDIGIETSYIIGIFEPYLGLSYSYDTDYDSFSTYDYDEDSFSTSIGSRIQWTESLSGDLSWAKVLSRNDQSEDSFMINIRYEF